MMNSKYTFVAVEALYKCIDLPDKKLSDIVLDEAGEAGITAIEMPYLWSEVDRLLLDQALDMFEMN